MVRLRQPLIASRPDPPFATAALPVRIGAQVVALHDHIAGATQVDPVAGVARDEVAGASVGAADGYIMGAAERANTPAAIGDGQAAAGTTPM